jgi:predicted nuclease of predicted toxin-antitoxin system
VAKDADFVLLLERHGPPPQLLWVTCGNVSNVRLQAIFQAEWRRAAALLAAGEPLVEIRGDR